MPTISLCMIVRNEEPVLARCLDCVQGIADEIIIVDTGSDDRTREIALRYTDRVYDFPWVDDFAAARNFAFSKATMDYQMWLDADDVIEPDSREKLLRLKAMLDADVVMLPYHTAFDSEGNPVFTYYRERLLRRACGFAWKGAVHECIAPAGRIIYGEAAVCHRKEHVNDPDRNLRIFERMRTEGRELSARESFYYACELYYHGMYREAVPVFSDFLQRPEGWHEDRITACLRLAQCCEALGEQDSALTALFQSFLYDAPRAEICCEIGGILLGQERWAEAAFWYRAALDAPFPDGQGFSQPDCHDYIPLMQLCVCCDRMGNLRQARAYNDRAGRIRPKDAAFLANQQYFRNQLNPDHRGG